MILIDGKEIANQIKAEIAQEVKILREERGRAPHLAAVLVGNDPASETYVANKEKACFEVGMSSSVYKIPADTTEEKLIETIEFINNDTEIDGLIVQLPIPKHISANRVIESILPQKDVDGFHPVNNRKNGNRTALLSSCYPIGISMLLERNKIETSGKIALSSEEATSLEASKYHVITKQSFG